MPVLRYTTTEGKRVEQLLDLRKGGDGKTAPLTMGSAPDAAEHIHVPGSDILEYQAHIVGSSKATAYAFVLSGRDLQVNGSRLECLRVLRHGDCIQIGQVEMTYLDFLPFRPANGSKLLGQKCSLATCPEDRTIKAEDEVVTCPWCGRVYHLGCWLEMERCAKGDCYPIRRMLMANLAGQVRLEKMQDKSDVASRICAANCSMIGPIEPGKEIIRCPQCEATYHPGCWLSWRGICPHCGLNFAEIVDRLVFHLEEESRS